MEFTGDKELFKIQAGLCSAFSNDKRLQILWAISEEECSVGEIARQLDISQSNVSQHLRVLRDKGVVVERKEGQQVFYRVVNSKIIEGYKLIQEGIKEMHKMKSDMFLK